MTLASLHHLPNGLQIVLDPVAAVESLTLGVWIKVGARHEPKALNGVAHLLEHMVFKGTKARSSFEIVSQIEGTGGSINAYTSRENTAYYCRLLQEDLGLGLDVLSDVIGAATLDAEDLDKERHVILSELHQAHDTPDDIIFDHFQETAFPGQGLGRSVLGTETVLNTIEDHELRQFRDQTYGAAAMTLVLSGRFDQERALDEIAARFSALPQGRATPFTPGTYRGGQYVDVRQDLEQYHVLIGWPGAALEGPGYYVQMLLATILGGGMSSRLFQEVREARGLAYSVSAYLSAFQDCGLFTAYAATEPEQLDELLPTMAHAMTQVAQDLDQSELKRAKQLIRAGLLMSQESTLARAESYAGQMQVFGKLMSNAQLLAPLEAVTVDQVRAAVPKLLSAPMTLALIGPQDSGWTVGRVEALFRDKLIDAGSSK